MDYPVFIFMCSIAVLGILTPVWFAHQIREEREENELTLKIGSIPDDSGSQEEEKTEDPEEDPEEMEKFTREEYPDLEETEVFNMILGKRVETVTMPICHQCPLEYMTIFLENREKIDKYHSIRSYRIKCSHFAACRRANWFGRHGGADSDGMDGAEV